MTSKQNAAAAVGAAAAVSVFGLVLFMLLLLPTNPGAAAETCRPASPSETVSDEPPDGEVAGYSGNQLTNAALIINAGETLDLGPKGLSIAVMTAMGESSLRVLDQGDAAGPDSRGLFQQRANGAWGSYTDRMDPTISATNFFKALLAVDGWETQAPTLAAHQVQHNADPYHYEKYWQDAVAVVAAVAGIDGFQSCLGQDPKLSGQGDDLPWASAPFCPIGGTCPPGAVSPLGMYNRECTDFALWRLNQMAGVTSAPWTFHNSDLALGNANTWIDAWHRQGWDVGQEPKVGAVAYYAPNVGGAGSLGHVAIVSQVSEDGTVTIEEYNGQAPPNDHQYGIRTIASDDVSAYLYFPG